MTLSEADSAWSDLLRRGAESGYGVAMAQIAETIRGQAYEEIARKFTAAGEPYVARMVREMRHQP